MTALSMEDACVYMFHRSTASHVAKNNSSFNNMTHIRVRVGAKTHVARPRRTLIKENTNAQQKKRKKLCYNSQGSI